MSYRQQRPQPAPDAGRTGTAYRRATAEVKARARAGEPCYFWRRNPNCPGPHFDWTLPRNHRHAFTAHHLDRLMDGGAPVPDPALMAPAHRGCNAWDGLRAQNARRAGHGPPPTSAPARAVAGEPPQDRTSQAW